MLRQNLSVAPILLNKISNTTLLTISSYESRSINKLQNSVILLVFQI